MAAPLFVWWRAPGLGGQPRGWPGDDRRVRAPSDGPPAYVLRRATPADVVPMVDRLHADAAAGHFAPAFPLSALVQLYDVVRFGEDRQIEGGRASADVLTEGGVPVAFGVVRELPALRAASARAAPAMAGAAGAARGEPVFELWLASVRPGARRRGVGGRLADALLARDPRDRTLVARLYPASATMRTLLERRGFRRLGRLPSGLDLFVRGSAADGAHVYRALRGPPPPRPPRRRVSLEVGRTGPPAALVHGPGWSLRHPPTPAAASTLEDGGAASGRGAGRSPAGSTGAVARLLARLRGHLFARSSGRPPERRESRG